jgi:outer membrane protein assembly factor BamB
MTKGFGLILSFVIGLVLFTILPVWAEIVDTFWVRTYNGPANSGDVTSAVAVDIFGNVYVTGASLGSGTGSDYATIKYNSNGTQLWVQRYNGPGSGNDGASAIAVDGSGNVYVTGSSQGSGTGSDYATIKYNSNGTQLWVQRYNGPGNSSDGAVAIAIDGSGNVYVTGSSQGSGTGSDYATVKYNSNGNQLWIQRYNGPGNGSDQATAIKVDGSGNVYVTGYGTGIGTYGDYTTIKYNSDGNQLWIQTYNGPANMHDAASAVAVDISGNVYVTGHSVGSGTSDDCATIKYDSNGSELWVRRYNGPGNAGDYAGVIVAGLNGVYVTGASRGGATYRDFATIKYDFNGNELWVQRYNGPAGNGADSATAMIADEYNIVYVTGYSWNGYNYDYATVAYENNGTQLWVRRYNGLGNGDDAARGIAIGQDNQSGHFLYVTGYSQGIGTNYDYVTIKYPLNRVYWQETADTIYAFNPPGQVNLHQMFDSYERITGMVHPFTWAGSSTGVTLALKACDATGCFAGAPFTAIWDYKSCSFTPPDSEMLGWTSFFQSIPPGTNQLFAVWTFQVTTQNSILCMDTILFHPPAQGNAFYWAKEGVESIIPYYLKKCWTVFLCRCGDANVDEIVDIGDIVYLINYVFYGGTEPLPNLDCNDVNADGVIDIGDIVLLINYVFYGGAEPNCG